MELLERYLQAVRFLLPRRDQDDIIRELSEDLRSQIEEREQELGRALTGDEVADILRRHGHPMIVAGRYRSRQYLIGPVFYPFYLFVLQAGLAVSLMVTLVLAGVDALLHGDALRHFIEGLLAYPTRALQVFAWTTLGFAGLDLARSIVKLPHTWDPRTLPKLMTREDRISRKKAICEGLLVAAGLVFLLLIARSPSMIFGPGSQVFDLAPVWRSVFIPMILLGSATLALNVVNAV